MDIALHEINNLWSRIAHQQVDELVKVLGCSKDKIIIGLGAGRMGYSVQSFMMRLGHIGYRTFMLGDTGLPRVDHNTIAVVNSSSGETPTMRLYVDQCSAAGCFIIALTTNPFSYIGQNADLVIQIPEIKSKQLMKSIYEQFTLIFYDYIAFEITSQYGYDVSFVEHNHSILE